LRKIIFFIVVIFSLLFSTEKINCQKTNEIDPIKGIIKKEIIKYPEMEIQDVYKLLHQSAMGSEHAVKDTAAVRKWMEKEISGLSWNHKEEMIDTISPGGKIVRINLRPYIKAGMNTEKLLNAFVKTANKFKGSKEVLERNLKCFLEMIEEGEVDFPKQEAENYFNELKEKGYPAVHHSKAYGEKYSPAYRVVAGELISQLKND